MKTHSVEFGRNMRGSESARVTAEVNLSVGLLMFEHVYNDFADLVGPFIEFCESRFPGAE